LPALDFAKGKDFSSGKPKSIIDIGNRRMDPGAHWSTQRPFERSTDLLEQSYFFVPGECSGQQLYVDNGHLTSWIFDRQHSLERLVIN
jgi:hypothetical protein